MNLSYHWTVLKEVGVSTEAIHILGLAVRTLLRDRSPFTPSVLEPKKNVEHTPYY